MKTLGTVRLLIIEDSDDDAALITNWLRRGGLDPIYEVVETAEAMAAALLTHPPELVLSDCKMPAFDADEALRVLLASGLDIPFIVVSGQIGEQAAADLMRAGAKDFVLKDDLTRLGAAIERELVEARDRRERDAERQELERQLHQAERLDTLGQLAGGIAHDFNNIIGVIKGSAELTLMELPGDHPSRPDVERIDQAAAQATALTRQLLIFSRLQPSDPETLDVNTVLTDTANLLSRTLGEDVQLETRLAAGLDCVTVDRGRLQQVIMNLAVNSRAAMPDGGRLTFITAVTDAVAAPQSRHDLPAGRYVRLTCIDTGFGMPPEVASRAFEPFFTTKEPGRGTGLGLATVYGVVKDASGGVTLHSEPGLGTRIDIYLPSAGPLIEVTGSDDVQEAPGGQEHILIVEDNPGMGDVAREILSRAGYQVILTSSRDEALRLAADHAITLDLMLTDIVMPGPGLSPFLRGVRALRPDITVVLMSGYNADQTLTDWRQPALPLVVKPFSGATLLRKVRSALASRP